MPINRKHKIIFIHNPKCAGSMMEAHFGFAGRGLNFNKHTLFGLHPIQIKREPKKKIPRFFYSLPVHHLTPQGLIDGKYITEQEFRDCFSFAFVRNPWDKIILSYTSYYHKLHPDFDKFLDWLIEINYVESSGEYFIHRDGSRNVINTHFTTQHKFIEYNGKQIVSFVGRYENLYDDFKIVCDRVNKPFKELRHVNKTSDRKDYREYYNENQKNIIAKLYHRDIELFNYEF